MFVVEGAGERLGGEGVVVLVPVALGGRVWKETGDIGRDFDGTSWGTMRMLEVALFKNLGLSVLPDVGGLSLMRRGPEPNTVGLVSARWKIGLPGRKDEDFTSELDFLRWAAGGVTSEALKNMSVTADDGLSCFKKREGVPFTIELPSGYPS